MLAINDENLVSGRTVPGLVLCPWNPTFNTRSGIVPSLDFLFSRNVGTTVDMGRMACLKTFCAKTLTGIAFAHNTSPCTIIRGRVLVVMREPNSAPHACSRPSIAGSFAALALTFSFAASTFAAAFATSSASSAPIVLPSILGRGG